MVANGMPVGAAMNLCRSASYVDRTFKGAMPRDLPVHAPTKFELALNLSTA